MKKILLLLALLASATLAAAQNTVTVSGDLIQMTGAQQNGVANQTFVRFRLRNYSGNVPRINGTGLLAPCVVDSDTRCDITPDSLGHFSLAVAGNDVVTPSNTYYDVMIYINGRLAFAGPYSFTQALCPSGCNLDTYGQLNPPPTPAINVAPFLSSNNIFTGTNTFNGAVTFNSTVIFGLGAQTFVTPRFTPPITINTANAITWSFTNPAAPRTITWPDPGGADSMVYLNATQTLTNKTLTSPTSTGTDAGTETLQNKTLGAGTAPSSPWATSVGGTGVNSTATFPASGVVDTTTATAILQNKTLTGASSGNSVQLLNFQGNSGAITGNGSAQNVFSYTMPANTMAAGKGIRIVVFVQQNGATNAAAMALNFGATNFSLGSFDAAGLRTGQYTIHIFNKPGVTNAQIITATGFPGANAFNGLSTSSTVDTTGSVIITITFTVASTTTITPILFLVEQIQ